MKRKKIQIASILLVFTVSLPVLPQEPDQKTLSARDAVSGDTLMLRVRQLSGEVPVVVGGEEHTIQSRNKNYPGNELTARFIAGLLAGWGYTVEEQTFNSVGRNIVGTSEGLLYPGQVYMLCAHYDSMPDSSVSPGSDDNASGVAAVLEAARVLSDVPLNFTVKYAFWDEEEYGYYGSEAYVARADSTHEAIRGVINLDMIAWDSDADSRIILDVTKTGDLGDDELWSTITKVNDQCGFLLDAAPTFELVRSDQRSFRESDFAVIGLHEDFFGDMNEFYHSTDDLVSHFNPDYFVRCSQLAICSLTELADGDLKVSVAGGEGQPQDFVLEQNYPNPFNPDTRIVYRLQQAGDVILEIRNERGQIVQTIKRSDQQAGRHTIVFRAGHLPSGIYTYSLRTGRFSETRKMLLIK